jgi:hypothetical protein
MCLSLIKEVSMSLPLSVSWLNLINFLHFIIFRNKLECVLVKYYHPIIWFKFKSLAYHSVAPFNENIFKHKMSRLSIQVHKIETP